MNKNALAHRCVVRSHERRTASIQRAKDVDRKILEHAQQHRDFESLRSRCRKVGVQAEFVDRDGLHLAEPTARRGVAPLAFSMFAYIAIPAENVVSALGWLSVVFGAGSIVLWLTVRLSRLEISLSPGDPEVEEITFWLESGLTRAQRKRNILHVLSAHPEAEFVEQASLWERLVRRGA